jgi:hypothetical protein
MGRNDLATVLFIVYKMDRKDRWKWERVEKLIKVIMLMELKGEVNRLTR